jgi:hypothetical protein
MHNLTQDGIANLGAQSARRHEIHRSPQQVLKIALHFEEPEEPTGRAKSTSRSTSLSTRASPSPSNRREQGIGRQAGPAPPGALQASSTPPHARSW